MAEQLVVRELTSETRPVVERLWQLYRHDLSEFRGTHAASGFRGTLPGENGTYNVRGLAPFLAADSARRAYLFYSGSSPVGLAFVALSGGRWVMHEFFVVRGARRRGFG
jgi:predicted acetyltransferase